MNRISVKLRVTIWYTLVMLVVSLIVLAGMTSVSRDMLDRDVERRIVQVVSEMSTKTVDRNGMLRPMPDFKMYEYGVHVVIYDEDFNVIKGQQVPFGITDEFNFSHDTVRKETYNGNEYYVYDREIKTPWTQKVYWIKGLVPVSNEEYAINTVFKNNLILAIVLIIVASLGGYFIISRAFVPVNKINKTAKEISKSKDLSRRINIGEGKDEIHSLANTFDEMLDKIEQTFEREKQFTSDASHELRTPIAVILSECEYATECAKTLEEAMESVKSVKRQADKMSKLVSELLTISRMDKNTLQINFEETDISELLSFVCEEQAEINNEKIKLEKNISDGIVAKCDRFLIARLFINLISNAYQYSREDGKIYVSLFKENDNIVFTVKDNGIGIAKEDLDKIWERFYQVNSSRTSNENGSVGLGLSMVKWIAEAHNANITVKSELGKGAEFKFIFPA